MPPGYWYIIFGEVSISSVAYFTLGYLPFYYSVLYISWITVLYQKYDLQISPPILWVVFLLS